MTSVEFAIVGAGPAGMAAAALAAELGLDTMLIDEQPAPGGQIYRGVERAVAGTPLGADYLAGRRLVEGLRAAARLDYRPKTTLWHLDPDGTLYLAAPGGASAVTARRVLLATGAIERPVPIPGWTLPGVMTAGAAQILLKGSDLVPEGRVVLAGQGPLHVPRRRPAGARRGAACGTPRNHAARQLSRRGAPAMARLADAAKGAWLHAGGKAPRDPDPARRARIAGRRTEQP